MAELGLQAADLAGLAGTGAGGRVTVDDLEKFLADLDGRTTRPAPAMRVAVGDAMRRSWARPLATVGRSARLDALLAHRKTQPEPKPGVVLYVIRALALALAEDSTLASRLIGKRLVPAVSVDIGFAVEVDDGLMGARVARCGHPSSRSTQPTISGPRYGSAAAAASAGHNRQRRGDP